MFAEERQQKILQLLEENGAVKVNSLSKFFQVTEETIRRDLEKLESEDQLKRTHGGAILVEAQNDDDIPFKERKVLMMKEKRSIAKAAAKLVKEQDVIFLDAGSTALYVAKALPNIAIRVLTNSLLVAYELNKKNNIQVILTGGNLTPHSLSLVGPATIRSIQNYYVNKMFFSCKGFDPTWGISDSNEQQAAVKKAVMEMAEEIILLVDHSKINKRSFVQIESMCRLHKIIVNEHAKMEALSNEAVGDITVIYSK
ncbi:MAG: DeoR/GlpR family DNA-binding transcription regulator [Solibacillus sp.]